MDNKQQKQEFLREQILNKGYDPSQFVTFMNTKLPIGDNLDLCSFEQLQAVVEQFIATKQSQQESFEPLAQVTQSVIEIPTSPKLYKTKPLLFTNYNPNMLESEFSKTFQCKKIIDNYNHLKSIKCIVSNPERKNTGGLFGIGSTSFLEFKVQTIELGWKVGRRYSDFIWLRDYLKRIYPMQILPPIPPKKAAKRTQKHIEKRMGLLQYFLNDLVSIRVILNDRFVEGFLSLTDHPKFQNLKKQSQKVSTYSGIGDYQNFQGKVDSKLSEQNKVFLEQMQKKVPQMQKIYKDITRGGKALQVHITNEVNTLYQMGNNFASLHEMTRDILNRIPKSAALKNLNDIYITLNNMMIQWGNIIKNQQQFFEKNFNTFFKYLRHQITGFTQVIAKEQELQVQYNKFKINLQKKKEKIYSLHDPTKWQLTSKELSSLPKQLIHDKPQAWNVMLPKQNHTLQKMRTNLFLYTDQLFKNGLVNFGRNFDRFSQNFKEFAIKVKVNNQQLGEMWMEMSANFSGPTQKIKQLKNKPKEEQLDEEQIDF